MGLGLVLFMIGLALIFHAIVGLGRQIISPDPSIRRDFVTAIIRLLTVLLALGFIAASYRVYPEEGMNPDNTTSIPVIRALPLDPTYDPPREELIPPITLERGD